MGGICIFAIYSADSKLILGATRTLERNRSLISLAKASLRFSLPMRRGTSCPDQLAKALKKEKGYVRQALLDLSEMVLYYVDKNPRDELCNRQAYRQIAEYLINTEYKIQKFAEGPKGFRQ